MEPFQQPFSKWNWEQNYQFQGEKTWDDTAKRNGLALAEPEDEKEKWAHKFYELIGNMRFLPGGRIIANAGTSYSEATLLNCFVSGPDTPDVDSIDEINAELGRCMKILASEGGYGVNANWMRPRGAIIQGTGARTPGAVEMLNMWDQTAETLTKGPEKPKEREDAKDKIRKGAMMVTMSLWHPDVREFITAKSEAGKLAHFNMSVLASDEFMEAVKTDSEWEFVYPAFEEQPTLYEETWDGNLDKWRDNGGRVKTYDTVPARELWEKVMDSTYNNNEPGVLFVDTINQRNPLYYCEYILGTNPCVAEGTLVNTPDGYKKVEDVEEGESILTVLGEEPVEEIEVHEDYPVYDVTFSDGTTQTVTAAHRYHVKEDGAKSIDKRRVDNMEEGDCVRIHANDLNFELDEDAWHRGVKRGIILGDGSISPDTLEGTNRDAFAICSSVEDAEYNERIRSLFNKDKQNLDTTSEGKACKIWIKGQHKLESLDVAPACAPDKTLDVSDTPRSELLGLFDGLIASDGNVNLKSNHPQLRYDSTSRDLAEAVRNIVIAFGGHATITTSESGKSVINGRKIEGNHKKYTVNISGASFRKMASISRMEDLHPGKSERLIKAQTDFKLSGNYMHAKVRSIEPAGTANVYDLYCEKSDTWITEGYVQQGCGEQCLPPGGACNLGNMVLPAYLEKEDDERFWDFDWEQFKEDIPVAVRLLDNVNDVSYLPLQEQRNQAQQKRRVGLGHMGFGSMLMMMGIRYGSTESAMLARQIQKTLTNEAYRASARLAGEKEAFPLYDQEKYMDGDMMQYLSEDVKTEIKQNGMRNSHLTSIQPTGNTSQVANIVSGGLEPVFSFQQRRSVEMPHLPDELEKPPRMPENEDDVWRLDGKVMWKAEKQFREVLWRCTVEGYEDWQVHPTRGIIKDFVNEDYAAKRMKEEGVWNPDASYVVKTHDLTVDDHVRVMTEFARYIDSAMSKTVNIPESYDYEDFKDLYQEFWESGVIKGGTTYRRGTMSAVLEDDDNDEEEQADAETKCPQCGSDTREEEGCTKCNECGWEKCAV